MTLERQIRRLVRRVLGKRPRHHRRATVPERTFPIGDSGYLIRLVDPATGCTSWRVEPKEAVCESQALGYGGA